VHHNINLPEIKSFAAYPVVRYAPSFENMTHLNLNVLAKVAKPQKLNDHLPNATNGMFLLHYCY